MNERLHTVMIRQRVSVDDLAAACEVDPKTVQRWISKGLIPRRRHRHAAADCLATEEAYLWPNAADEGRAVNAEVVRVYAHRADIAADLWRNLFDNATERIDILVYVGYFLSDDPTLMRLIEAKAVAGVAVRLLFGDPDAPALAKRGVEEGIGPDAIPTKARNILALFRRLADIDGIEIRLHGTTLYNSIYRFGSEMIVNTHVLGLVAPHCPALHLRKLAASGMFDTYAACFDRIWEQATPAWPQTGGVS